MKLRLPLNLSVLLCLPVMAIAETVLPPPPSDSLKETIVFTDSRYLLESDETLVNPNWSGDISAPTNSISFDGQGEHSLTLEKNASGTSKDFIQIGSDSQRHKGSSTVSFENLQDVSLNNTDEASSKGGAVSMYQSGGNGSVEFSHIAGNVAIEGFRPESAKSTIIVASDKGNSSISFSDIGGNITVSDNKQTSGMPIGGAALTAWVDVNTTMTPYTPYKASVSFSNVRGNITFSNNSSGYAGGAINAASFNGQAQVKFSNVQGNTTFSNNSSIQGGAIHIQGFYDSTQEDVALTYKNSTGNVTFSNNSATSGGAVSVTGINQTIQFTNIKGDVVFQGNSATKSGGAILLGDYTLGSVQPISSYKFPDLNRKYRARLEFSNIEGNVSFLNNSVTTKNGGGKGGAIYIGDTRGYSPTFLYLSADKGNITFSGNTVDNTANAIHLEGQTYTYLRAQEGHSITFYDPITSNTGSLAYYERYNFYINQTANNTTYDGRVIFSGANINAETLGGDASTLDARLAASRTSKINGNILVYGGTMEITDGAIVHCNSAQLYKGSTLQISNGGELRLALNGAANTGLIVDSGAFLMTGDTTMSTNGNGSLETNIGISGGLLEIADGAILGTFVHDTGKTTKEAIVSSMKEGFGTSDHTKTKYLYQIGKNVEMEGIVSISGNEILNSTEGGNVTVSTIEAGGQAIADKGGSISVESIQEGGSVSVSSGTAEITAQETATLGSFSQDGTETTNAQVRVDSSSENQSVINAASTSLKAVENETTTINNNTIIFAKSVEVTNSTPEGRTTLVNDGTINSQVNVSGDGAVIKGSGTFGGGLSITSGGVLIVGNSPGLQIYTNSVDIAGSKVIFSVDGLQQATQTTNGWGSGTYSNIQMQQGIFHWDAGTALQLEISTAMTSIPHGTAIDLVLMTFHVGNDSSNSVSEITLGNQIIWDGVLYTELVGTPLDIEMSKSLTLGEIEPELVRNLKDGKLVSSFDQEQGIVTVSLQGQVVSVPEPSTSIMGLLGFTMLLFRRRK